MKKTILAVAIATLAAVSAFAAEPEKEMKTGWTMGVLPSVSFSTDMGFQYGAFGDVYNYGNGSTYPDPLHKISWEISHYTKGRSRFYLAYDSKYLIPKLRVTGSATYIDDPMYAFYGFNGLASQFDGNLMLNADNNIAFYTMNRNMLRLLADFQGVITPSMRWCAGVSFWKFNTSTFNSERYSSYNADYTLYNLYKATGVIKDSEADGGMRLEMKAGVVYDTRDIEAAPNKGIWGELYMSGSPDVFGDGFKYLKLNATLRQYISIPLGLSVGDPVFAYRLAYQQTIAGEAPFYMQQNINALILKQMLSEGLGSSNSLRGTYANRVIADGYAWGNFELRIKLVKFTFLKQYFYVAANPFFDCGIVTKPYRAEEMASFLKTAGLASMIPGVNIPGADITATAEKVAQTSQQFMSSLGGGLKIAWNQNFIVSLEAAHNFNKGLGGPFWMSIGTNYVF